MSKKNIDISTLVQAYNEYKLTTFQKRINPIRSSERGKTILEYFNNFICSNETGRYNSNQPSYYNQVYGSSGNRSEEEIFAAPELKKFDPYVLYSIKEAVKQGVIKPELLGQFDFFVDMVDLAEQEMQRFDEIGKTPNQRQVNSILKNALVATKSKAIREDQAESIENKMSREKAGELLTEYTLSIPIQQIDSNEVLKTLRGKQILALFAAYQDGNTHGSHSIKIDEKNTGIDTVRRVLSKDSRVQYDGKLAVNSDDITAVARASEALKQLKQNDNTQVLAMVENIIRKANIIREQTGQKHLSLSQVLPKEATEAVVKEMLENKKELGKEDFKPLATRSRTGILSKATNLLSRAIESLGLNKNRDNQGIQK